jgi:biopolymer transport protein ExbD
MSNLKPFRRRPRAFMLTPLVDVMFLLLIFFMVSSQTAPYSMLTISEPAGAAQEPTAQPQPASAPSPSREVLVSISLGYVRFNGQRVDLAELPGTIATYMARGIQSAMILSTPNARVQDIVTVLEAFQDAHFANTRLMMQVPSKP